MEPELLQLVVPLLTQLERIASSEGVGREKEGRWEKRYMWALRVEMEQCYVYRFHFYSKRSHFGYLF